MCEEKDVPLINDLDQRFGVTLQRNPEQEASGLCEHLSGNSQKLNVQATDISPSLRFPVRAKEAWLIELSGCPSLLHPLYSH